MTSQARNRAAARPEHGPRGRPEQRYSPRHTPDRGVRIADTTSPLAVDSRRCVRDARSSQPRCGTSCEGITQHGRGSLAQTGPSLDPEAVSWLQTSFLKTELELGHCLRTPAEGPCECDLVLTCSKFLTTSDYAPRIRARLDVEQQLIDDATARGWPREIERHTMTKNRIKHLLDELDGRQAPASP